MTGLTERQRLAAKHRRFRPERAAWNVGATMLAEVDERTTKIGIARKEGGNVRFTSRPYLLEHPEREIAGVESIGRRLFASCPACGIDVFLGRSTRDTPWTLANEHNALIHPRRARKANA